MSGLVGRVEQLLEPETLARRFHEAYERLAPEFGYETRRESAVPWEDVPEANRRLMVAVAAAAVVNLVEPLARVAVAALVVAELEDMNQPNTRALFAAWTELRGALAAVSSGEPDE